MFGRSLGFLLALAACTFAGPAGAATSRLATCPVDSVSLLGAVTTITTAATFDTTSVVGDASWDLVAGRVYMLSNGWLGGVKVDVFDDYDVAGVAAGTPVNVLAVLTVDGAVWTAGCGGTGCSGMYQVDFIHGADVQEVLHSDHLFSGRLDHHDVLLLPLTITAGQPERLEIEVVGHRNPGGSHDSEATCVLSFAQVPEGVTVTSCQGFVGTPVPARASSWGRVKTLYR